MTDLLIVGAGPAGLAAAARAGSFGLATVLVDENVTPGGQYYRQPAMPGVRLRDAHARRGQAEIERAAAASTLRLGCSAYAIDGERGVWLMDGDGLERVVPRAVLLATGGHDLPVAFPGWTLPGVVSAGAAQALIKSQAVQPGRRGIVVGAGPFIWVVADQLRRAGVTVVEVAEATTLRQSVAGLPASLRAPGRYLELARYVLPLVASGTRVTTGHIVTAAEGKDYLEAVRLRPRSSWTQQRDQDRLVDADLLCVAYGFAASTELARLAGCGLTWDPGLGQMVPEVDDWQSTDRTGVFVAGEACGLGGAAVAALEGELAAIGAARLIGAIGPVDANRAAARVRGRMHSARAFADLLPRLFPRPAELADLATEETTVCRCENVSLASALRAVDDSGAIDLNEVKTSTRCGMGWCQGRVCGSVLSTVLPGRRPGFGRESTFTARGPVRPVPLGAIAALESAAQPDR